MAAARQCTLGVCRCACVALSWLLTREKTQSFFGRRVAPCGGGCWHNALLLGGWVGARGEKAAGPCSRCTGTTAQCCQPCNGSMRALACPQYARARWQRLGRCLALQLQLATLQLTLGCGHHHNYKHWTTTTKLMHCSSIAPSHKFVVQSCAEQRNKSNCCLLGARVAARIGPSLLQ